MTMTTNLAFLTDAHVRALLLPNECSDSDWSTLLEAGLAKHGCFTVNGNRLRVEAQSIADGLSDELLQTLRSIIEAQGAWRQVPDGPVARALAELKIIALNDAPRNPRDVEARCLPAGRLVFGLRAAADFRKIIVKED